MATGNRMNVVDCLGKGMASTLVVHSEDGKMVPLEQGRLVESLIPDMVAGPMLAGYALDVTTNSTARVMLGAAMFLATPIVVIFFHLLRSSESAAREVADL
jgi:hypothetical protein